MAHAPSHLVTHPGAFVLTGGTLHKKKILDSDAKLDVHLNLLFEVAEEFGWELQAWAVFANHYHLVALSPDEGSNFPRFLSKLHSCSSRAINKLDGKAGRKVWCNYWDTRITFEKSYLARLNYVHTNPVKHRLAANPRDYRWCSADWFFLRAERSFHETVSSFPIDTVKVYDDFD